MSIQPDHSTLNMRRIEAKIAEWARAGRELHKAHARGLTCVDPGDIISRAEQPDHHCKEN